MISEIQVILLLRCYQYTSKRDELKLPTLLHKHGDHNLYWKRVFMLNQSHLKSSLAIKLV